METKEQGSPIDTDQFLKTGAEGKEWRGKNFSYLDTKRKSRGWRGRTGDGKHNPDFSFHFLIPCWEIAPSESDSELMAVANIQKQKRLGVKLGERRFSFRTHLNWGVF